MARRSSALSAVDRVTVAATALAVLTLPPRDWLDRLGAWTDLVAAVQPFLGLVALVLVGQMAIARQRLALVPSRRRADREVIASDGMGIHRLLGKVREILDQQARAGDGEPQHRARIVMLTGRSVVDPLFELVRSRPPGRWRIEILIVAPTSPVVGVLEHRTRHDVDASLGHLAELQEMARQERWPYEIEYRMYEAAPTMRGFLIDDRHLFVGYTAWTGDRLTTQGRRLVYVPAGTEANDLEIEWFRSWFDRVFLHGRRAAGTGGAVEEG